MIKTSKIYSDLKRKKMKIKQHLTKLHDKRIGKTILKMIMLTINVKFSRPQTAPPTVCYMVSVTVHSCMDFINPPIQLFDSVEESDLKTDEFPFKVS